MAVAHKENLAAHFYLSHAAAYIRGKLDWPPETASCAKPLDELSSRECEALFRMGQAAGLKLHRFKRSASLPRIQKALGILKAMRPSKLLDIGTGRGVFLWPLLDTFPSLPVTCIDRLDHRIADIMAAAAGGIAFSQAHIRAQPRNWGVKLRILRILSGIKTGLTLSFKEIWPNSGNREN